MGVESRRGQLPRADPRRLSAKMVEAERIAQPFGRIDGYHCGDNRRSFRKAARCARPRPSWRTTDADRRAAAGRGGTRPPSSAIGNDARRDRRVGRNRRALCRRSCDAAAGFDNPFYKSLTAEFAGSEAFAALQRLYDLHQAGAFELEVVDTPPASHSFEFLQTPARLIRLLDSRTARWLFTPSLSAGRIAMKVASEAARFDVRELERFAGNNVLSTITDFFAAMAESMDGIIDRLQKTEALLRSPAARFVMVTTAEPDRIRQARELLVQMDSEGLKLSAIVINRFLDETTWTAVADSGARPLSHLAEISELRASLPKD